VADGVLNIAGPRASRHANVYDRAKAFVLALLGGEELRPVSQDGEGQE
jgi:hypothetical protein